MAIRQQGNPKPDAVSVRGPTPWLVGLVLFIGLVGVVFLYDDGRDTTNAPSRNIPSSTGTG